MTIEYRALNKIKGGLVLKIKFGARDVNKPFPREKTLYIWDPSFGYTIEEIVTDSDGKELHSFETTWFGGGYEAVFAKRAFFFVLIVALYILIRWLIF